ncbi:hypothetical protein, partial [Streptomyces sp. B15]|uniref:hypothetical protein n=1 Tax=Streptomyces sp. B15 TaxID=1537797 RepID=UPI001B377C01
ARRRGTAARHGGAARRRGTAARHGGAARRRGTAARHGGAARRRGTAAPGFAVVPPPARVRGTTQGRRGK